jgi:anti-sigma B factor antagonist
VYRRSPGATHLTDTFEAPEFALHADRDGAVATISVQGELDVATAPDLIAAIGALEPGYDELVIDLSQCSFFASSGISVLLDENARATAAGFRFVVVKAPPEVQRIFDLTSLEDIITFRER